MVLQTCNRRPREFEAEASRLRETVSKKQAKDAGGRMVAREGDPISLQPN